MDLKDIKIVKSILGEDIFDVLKKYEIYKPNTKTVVDPEEIKVALQIVPRAILSFLFNNLRDKEVGEVVELDLPFCPNSKLNINKQGADNYKGEIIKDGKKISEFQYRSLPSIGLILLSTFELYDMSLLNEVKEPKTEECNKKVEQLQDVIDERLTFHRLIQDVVDRRINEREAINRLINEKLNNHIKMVNVISTEIEETDEMKEEDKTNKLRQFLENREKKRQESIELDKSEIKCPDCGTSLYKGGDSVKLCLCYGEFMNKEIKIKKNENGTVNLNFPKSFHIDNIEMILEAIKKR